MYTVDKIYQFACAAPDRTAWVHDLEPISYRTLHLMVTRMRERLTARGVRGGPGLAVVQIASIKVSWIVDLALRSMGILTAAINSAAELEALEGQDVVLVVTDGSARVSTDAFPAAPRIAVDEDDWRVVDDGSPLAPPPPSRQGGHILFTSGTTGLRKKIMIDTDEGLAIALDQYGDQVAEYEVLVMDLMVNVLNVGLWSAGGYGAPLKMWSLGGGVVTHQGEGAERSFAVPGLTHATVTPALLEQLLRAPPEVLPRNDNLELSVVAGALSVPLANRTRERLTTKIVTVLGSTEGGLLAMTPVETVDDLRWHRLEPSRVVQVVDENHQPLPPREVGQVRVLQQPGEPREYLDDPLTTRAFFRDGWFYPGDLGMLDGQGRLALAGRVTDVLVVKGDKIPSAPIEEDFQAALDMHGVCALSEQAEDGTDALHIVLETSAPLDQARLKVLAKPYLAYFPTVSFHDVPAFPRNDMGKVNRMALRRLLSDRQTLQAMR